MTAPILADVQALLTSAEVAARQSELAEKIAKYVEEREKPLRDLVKLVTAAASTHEWDTFRTNSDGYPISDERMCSTCGAFAQDGWKHEDGCEFAAAIRAGGEA